MDARHGEAQTFMAAALDAETDDCILWPFSLTGGYPQFWSDGRNGYGHHYACIRKHGQCPPGHEAAHSCGTKPCINTRHLRWATRAQNEADKIAHGRANQGERHGMAKLTAEAVLSIRSAAGTQREIAAQFDITQSAVSAIRSKRIWRHL